MKEFCAGCGGDLPANAKFCPSCGADQTVNASPYHSARLLTSSKGATSQKRQRTKKEKRRNRRHKADVKAKSSKSNPNSRTTTGSQGPRNHPHTAKENSSTRGDISALHHIESKEHSSPFALPKIENTPNRQPTDTAPPEGFHSSSEEIPKFEEGTHGRDLEQQITTASLTLPSTSAIGVGEESHKNGQVREKVRDVSDPGTRNESNNYDDTFATDILPSLFTKSTVSKSFKQSNRTRGEQEFTMQSPPLDTIPSDHGSVHPPKPKKRKKRLKKSGTATGIRSKTLKGRSAGTGAYVRPWERLDLLNTRAPQETTTELIAFDGHPAPPAPMNSDLQTDLASNDLGRIPGDGETGEQKQTLHHLNRTESLTATTTEATTATTTATTTAAIKTEQGLEESAPASEGASDVRLGVSNVPDTQDTSSNVTLASGTKDDSRVVNGAGPDSATRTNEEKEGTGRNGTTGREGQASPVADSQLSTRLFLQLNKLNMDPPDNSATGESSPKGGHRSSETTKGDGAMRSPNNHESGGKTSRWSTSSPLDTEDADGALETDVSSKRSHSNDPKKGKTRRLSQKQRNRNKEDKQDKQREKRETSEAEPESSTTVITFTVKHDADGVRLFESDLMFPQAQRFATRRLPGVGTGLGVEECLRDCYESLANNRFWFLNSVGESVAAHASVSEHPQPHSNEAFGTLLDASLWNGNVGNTNNYHDNDTSPSAPRYHSMHHHLQQSDGRPLHSISLRGTSKFSQVVEETKLIPQAEALGLKSSPEFEMPLSANEKQQEDYTLVGLLPDPAVKVKAQDRHYSTTLGKIQQGKQRRKVLRKKLLRLSRHTRTENGEGGEGGGLPTLFTFEAFNGMKDKLNSLAAEQKVDTEDESSLLTKEEKIELAGQGISIEQEHEKRRKHTLPFLIRRNKQTLNIRGNKGEKEMEQSFMSRYDRRAALSVTNFASTVGEDIINQIKKEYQQNYLISTQSPSSMLATQKQHEQQHQQQQIQPFANRPNGADKRGRAKLALSTIHQPKQFSKPGELAPLYHFPSRRQPRGDFSSSQQHFYQQTFRRYDGLRATHRKLFVPTPPRRFFDDGRRVEEAVGVTSNLSVKDHRRPSVHTTAKTSETDAAVEEGGNHHPVAVGRGVGAWPQSEGRKRSKLSLYLEEKQKSKEENAHSKTIPSSEAGHPSSHHDSRHGSPHGSRHGSRHGSVRSPSKLSRDGSVGRLLLSLVSPKANRHSRDQAPKARHNSRARIEQVRHPEALSPTKSRQSDLSRGAMTPEANKTPRDLNHATPHLLHASLNQLLDKGNTDYTQLDDDWDEHQKAPMITATSPTQQERKDLQLLTTLAKHLGNSLYIVTVYYCTIKGAGSSHRNNEETNLDGSFVLEEGLIMEVYDPVTCESRRLYLSAPEMDVLSFAKLTRRKSTSIQPMPWYRPHEIKVNSVFAREHWNLYFEDSIARLVTTLETPEQRDERIEKYTQGETKAMNRLLQTQTMSLHERHDAFHWNLAQRRRYHHMARRKMVDVDLHRVVHRSAAVLRASVLYPTLTSTSLDQEGGAGVGADMGREDRAAGAATKLGVGSPYSFAENHPSQQTVISGDPNVPARANHPHSAESATAFSVSDRYHKVATRELAEHSYYTDRDGTEHGLVSSGDDHSMSRDEDLHSDDAKPDTNQNRNKFVIPPIATHVLPRSASVGPSSSNKNDDISNHSKADPRRAKSKSATNEELLTAVSNSATTRKQKNKQKKKRNRAHSTSSNEHLPIRDGSRDTEVARGGTSSRLDDTSSQHSSSNEQQDNTIVTMNLPLTSKQIPVAEQQQLREVRCGVTTKLDLLLDKVVVRCLVETRLLPGENVQFVIYYTNYVTSTTGNGMQTVLPVLKKLESIATPIQTISRMLKLPDGGFYDLPDRFLQRSVWLLKPLVDWSTGDVTDLALLDPTSKKLNRVGDGMNRTTPALQAATSSTPRSHSGHNSGHGRLAPGGVAGALTPRGRSASAKEKELSEADKIDALQNRMVRDAGSGLYENNQHRATWMDGNIKPSIIQHQEEEKQLHARQQRRSMLLSGDLKGMIGQQAQNLVKGAQRRESVNNAVALQTQGSFLSVISSVRGHIEKSSRAASTTTSAISTPRDNFANATPYGTPNESTVTSAVTSPTTNQRKINFTPPNAQSQAAAHNLSDHQSDSGAGESHSSRRITATSSGHQKHSSTSRSQRSGHGRQQSVVQNIMTAIDGGGSSSKSGHRSTSNSDTTLLPSLSSPHTPQKKGQPGEDQPYIDALPQSFGSNRFLLHARNNSTRF